MATETATEPAMRVQSRSRRAGELAHRQFGPIARRQLLELGFTPTRIGRWLETGLLHIRYPGVYAYGRPDLPEEGELAAGLLYAGTGSALTGLSELWWMGFLHRRPDLIHLDAPGDRSSRDDLCIRHPQAIHRQFRRGLPVTALPRALLLATEALRHNSLRLVLARAEFAKALDLPSLQAAIASGPRGARVLRAAMDAHLPQLAHCASASSEISSSSASAAALSSRSRTRGSADTARTCSGGGNA